MCVEEKGGGGGAIIFPRKILFNLVNLLAINHHNQQIFEYYLEMSFQKQLQLLQEKYASNAG